MVNVILSEFDTLSCGDNDISKSDFDTLLEFIRNNHDDNNPDLLTPCFVPGKPGISVRASRYVGLIQFASGSTLEILPKICLDVNQARKLLLEMLSVIDDVSFKDFDNSSIGREDVPILEFFIRHFIRKLWYVVRSGIASTYYEMECNEPFLRGSLVFSEQMKNIVSHKAQFYIRYQLFGINRPENRLIKSTLKYLNKLSFDLDNKREINILLSYFDGIPESFNYETDLNRVCIDRNMNSYDIVMKWVRVFLEKQSFDMYRGEEISFALLFRMDHLYQEFIKKKLSILSKGRFIIKNESRSLFEDTRNLKLIPDIVIETPNKTVVILDTKWKIITQPSDISESDLYQMITYSSKYNSNKILLIYPKKNQEQPIVMREKLYNQEITVSAYFVDLINVEDSLSKLIDLISI